MLLQVATELEWLRSASRATPEARPESRALPSNMCVCVCVHVCQLVCLRKITTMCGAAQRGAARHDETIVREPARSTRPPALLLPDGAARAARVARLGFQRPQSDFLPEGSLSLRDALKLALRSFACCGKLYIVLQIRHFESALLSWNSLSESIAVE